MEDRISRLNRNVTGWIGYFQLASAKSHCEQVDQWIRRRLRMCLWKQWKGVRTRIRELRAWCTGVGLLRDGLLTPRSFGNVPEHK
nr:group II intron maturase-specific domain-containing protein [Paenibacillus hemerocallicola]